MTIRWYMVPEISTARDRCFFDTLGRFLPFYSLNSPENENIKKWKKKKKKTGDIVILQKCTKNLDHRLYCSWEIACDTCNCYFSFWAIFCPFTSLTAQKTPGDIIILHYCTKSHDYMLYCSWDMAHDGCNCCLHMCPKNYD